jgi:hypothetical protein
MGVYADAGRLRTLPMGECWLAHGHVTPEKAASYSLVPPGTCRGALISLRTGAYHGASRTSQDENTGTGAGKDVMALPQILVVEDELIVALDLARRLARLGFNVTRVTSISNISK